MSHRILSCLIALMAVAAFTACSDDRSNLPSRPLAPLDDEEATLTPGDPIDLPLLANPECTPFQRAIAARMAERSAQGLPVAADVSFEHEFPSGITMTGLLQNGLPPGGTVSIVARTTIHYDHPAQAGHASWPPIVIDDRMPPGGEGLLVSGDHSQLLQNGIEEALPGFWQHYAFGQEPRTYHFTETITYTAPHGGPGEDGAETALTSTTADEFLLGFTREGPGLDYTLDWDFEVCDPITGLCATAVDFLAGFALDWDLGIRLPFGLSVTSPDPVNEGDTFIPTGIVEGLNWTAQEFIDAGVLPEDGNEFVMSFRFVLGVFLDIFGIPVVDIGFNVDIDESSSFTTPLGPGETFSLPSIDVPLREFGGDDFSLSFGFTVTPNAGSDELNAHWEASAEASGAGDLTFHASGDSEDLDSVFAIDGPGTAAILVDEFEYVFTQLILDLGIFVDLNVFGVVEEDWEIPVTDFDLSDITPDISMGLHDDSTPVALNASIDILNVAPTAEIDRTGTVMINGIPTFITRTGEEVTFTGHAEDPGRDDLILRWDWGDGDPSPDVETTYPVPYDVTESQDHVFTGACMYQVTFSAEDDDGAMGQDQVWVLVTEGLDSASRLEGYWQHQLSGRGNLDFDEATLDCYLAITEFVSMVFDEARDATPIPAAHDILFLKRSGGLVTEQLDRELLVAWLNFAHGAFEFDEPVDTDGDGMPDTPFAAALGMAELVRLDPLATAPDVRRQTWIVHHINAARTGQAEIAGPPGRSHNDRLTGSR